MNKSITDVDKKLLNNFYKEALENYGSYDVRAVRWSNAFSQNIRFQSFLEMGNLENKSILDIGCGLGDLYFFLKSNLKNFQYLGIDIMEDFVKEAKKKYPEAEFKHNEIEQIEADFFDYAFASGTFSLKIENYYEKYTELIEEIYNKVKMGFGFNLLKKGKHLEDEYHVTYLPEDIMKLCKEFASKVVLKENYLDYDFTIFLYK